MPNGVYLNGSIGPLSTFRLTISSIGKRNQPFNELNQAKFETLVSAGMPEQLGSQAKFAGISPAGARRQHPRFPSVCELRATSGISGKIYGLLKVCRLARRYQKCRSFYGLLAHDASRFA
jgi:hypothetical protein